MIIQHRGKTVICLITLAFLLVSCTPAASIPPTNTVTPSVVPSPTNTIIPSPTNTSIPVSTPTFAPTPVPWGHTPISSETAGQITQLTMWGTGEIQKGFMVAQNKNIVVSTPLGVYLYRLDDFTLLTFAEGATDLWVSPDGELFATAYLDASIKLWQSSDGSLAQTLFYKIGNLVHAFDFTDLTSWELESLSPNYVKSYTSMPVNTLVFSYDNKTLAAGYGDARIGIWDIGQDTPKSVLSSAYLRYPAEEMTYSSDGQYLAVNNGYALLLWQSTNENPVWAKKTYAENQVFSPNGSILAFIEPAAVTRVVLLEIPSGDELRQIDPEMNPFSISFSEDGQTLFIDEWNYETNEFIRQTRNVADNVSMGETPVAEETFPLEALRMKGHVNLRPGISVPANQEIQARITTIEKENFLWLLPDDQFTPLKEPKALCTNGLLEVEYPDGTQYSVQVSLHPLCEGVTLVPGQNQAVVWTSDRLSLVSLPGGETVDLQGHEEKINLIAFGDNNRLMASGTIAPEVGGEQGKTTSEIMLWQLDPLKEIGHTEKLDTGDMRIMLFSPDATLLASAGAMLRLWRVPGGQLYKYMHTYAFSLAFSPDGKILASGDWYGNIHLWQVSDGTELAKWKGHADKVIGLAFTPDGTSLVSASDDGTVRLWGIK